MNELVFKAIDRLEEALSNASSDVLGYAPPHDEEAVDLDESSREAALAELKQKEIDIGIMQLESLLNAIVDKDFDKFEIYTLRNILAVGHQEDVDLARWIRLSHYQDLTVEPGLQQISPEEVQLQRRKRHETAKLNIMLKEEKARNEAVIEQLQSMLNKDESAPLSLLAMASQPSPLQASQGVAYILDQLPAIQQCLAELKASLAQPVSSARLDADSSTAKRRRYLQQQSVKALELRGLTIEGSDQALPARRMVNKDEVEGLEAVVQSLGGTDRRPD